MTGTTSPVWSDTFNRYRPDITGIFDENANIIPTEGQGIYELNHTALELTGTAHPGAEITIELDNRVVATVAAGSDGTWRYSHPFTLSDTGIIYQVSAHDWGVDPDTGTYYFPHGSPHDSVRVVVLPEEPSALPTATNSTFDIEFDLTDPSLNILSASDRTKLESRLNSAAQAWEDIIQYDAPDFQNIDDVLVKIRLDQSDRSLATTGGYWTRPVGEYAGQTDPFTGQPLSNYENLPYFATMDIHLGKLPVNTLLNTQFGYDTLQHEIGHAIGLNADVYGSKGLYTEEPVTSRWTSLTRPYMYGFTGEEALNEYHARGGNYSHTSVPLHGVASENDRNAHWNEWLFPDGIGEYFDTPYLLAHGYVDTAYSDGLMTYSFAEGANKTSEISTLTVAALRDIGYAGASGGAAIPIFQSISVDPVYFDSYDLVPLHPGGEYSSPLADLGF